MKLDWSQFEQHLKAEIVNLGGRYVWTDVMLQGGYHIQKNVKNGQYRLLNGYDKVLLKSDFETCKAKLESYKKTFKSDHLVLLIHGLGRHAGIMKKPMMALRKEGYAAHSLNYATLFEGVDDHAAHFTYLLQHLKGIKKVSFVTHSLGGLVTRELLSHNTEWNGAKAHKLVMMGTPNKGAQIADFLGDLKPYEVIAGQSGQDVRPEQVLKEFPEPEIPTLVVAGGLENDKGFNPLLKGDNDGIVTVDETRLTTDHEFLLIHAIHTILMDNKTAIQKTIDFLSSE